MRYLVAVSVFVMAASAGLTQTQLGTPSKTYGQQPQPYPLVSASPYGAQPPAGPQYVVPQLSQPVSSVPYTLTNAANYNSSVNYNQLSYGCPAPQKVCVPEPAVKRISHTIYSKACEEFCLPCCNCLSFFSCCGSCLSCDGPFTKYYLVKKIRVEECPIMKCVPAAAPGYVTTLAPGSELIPLPGGSKK